MTPLFVAHHEIFKRYAIILRGCSSGDPGDKTSPGHLLKVCEEAMKRQDFPDDKTSRWLGFVQGVMAVKGLICVDEERNITRASFHKAYKEMDIEKPLTTTV